MTLPIALPQYPQNLAAPATTTTSFGGRLYQRLFCGSAISQCFQKTKDCFAWIYGPLFPPLPPGVVSANYLSGSIFLFGGFMSGIYALFAIIQKATNPSPDSKVSPEAAIPILFFLEAVCLYMAVRGFIVIHKTKNTPKLEVENQPLFPA